jgi:hypothetical protein
MILDFNIRLHSLCFTFIDFLRRFIMNESALCCRRMSGCLDVGNEMYCDETTNATNIPFGTNVPHDN